MDFNVFDNKFKILAVRYSLIIQKIEYAMQEAQPLIFFFLLCTGCPNLLESRLQALGKEFPSSAPRLMKQSP